MVSAARLRRAEQRIEALRPYARGIRLMARRAVEAAENIPGIPVLQDRENVNTVGIVAVTSDRGLAGAFNSQIIRAANRRRQEHRRVRRENLEEWIDVHFPTRGAVKTIGAGS